MRRASRRALGETGYSDAVVEAYTPDTALVNHYDDGARPGTTVLKVVDGLIVEEIGLDDGVKVLQQLGIIPSK